LLFELSLEVEISVVRKHSKFISHSNFSTRPTYQITELRRIIILYAARVTELRRIIILYAASAKQPTIAKII